ncbi:hypothetical protein BT96DRAFT_923676, partial [Gymnopus androsaceus JB14]
MQSEEYAQNTETYTQHRRANRSPLPGADPHQDLNPRLRHCQSGPRSRCRGIRRGPAGKNLSRNPFEPETPPKKEIISKPTLG